MTRVFNSKQKNVLLVFKRSNYSLELHDLIKSLQGKNVNIAYVCFNKSYADVFDEIKELKIDTKHFFFVDILSSHYSTPKPIDNCIFVKDPSKIDDIVSAIETLANKKKCKIIILDPLSELLMFQSVFSITKFANYLNTKIIGKGKNGIFVVLDEDDYLKDDIKKLTKDLTMFTDKIIEVC